MRCPWRLWSTAHRHIAVIGVSAYNICTIPQRCMNPFQVWGKTGSKLYGQKSGSDFVDNQKRFLLFSKAALCALHMLPFSPGTDSIVVCNDWHTAMLPVLLKVCLCPDTSSLVNSHYVGCLLHLPTRILRQTPRRTCTSPEDSTSTQRWRCVYITSRTRHACRNIGLSDPCALACPVTSIWRYNRRG